MVTGSALERFVCFDVCGISSSSLPGHTVGTRSCESKFMMPRHLLGLTVAEIPCGFFTSA